MSRVQDKWDSLEDARYMRDRNVKCSNELLAALIEHHGEVEPEPAPAALPPIPNIEIAKAIDLAFPRFMSRIEAIQRATLTEYPAFKVVDIKSQRRSAALVEARQIGMYLAKTLCEFSYPEIGRRFGGRDHTTAIHSVQKITQCVASDPAMAAKVNRIKDALPANFNEPG